MADKIIPFTMPKWGIEMEEGVIREWHAQEGDTVNEGDLFVVIETDKIANDVELEFTGTLRKRIGEEEETYRVGALIAVFAESDVSDSDIDAFIASFNAADAGLGNDDGEETSLSDSVAPLSAETPPSSSQSEFKVPNGLSISPKALELARTIGVDLSQVEGSGRNGRISLQDIEQAAKRQGLVPDGSGKNEPPAFEIVKLNSMRRTIAKRLTEATRNVPQYYVRMKVDMDALLSLRAERKATGAAPSINDYLVKAAAVALTKNPDVNVHFTDDAIKRYRHADINVAVSVPGGLIAPVIRHADEKSVDDISEQMKDLAERARGEKLQPHEYEPGSFSLSNLGMFGVSSFDAFINPPMAAILAASGIEREPTEGSGFRSVMTATLTCDHRAIDGALAGEFLRSFKDAVESPETL